MAIGMRDTRGGTGRAVRRCAVLACALASVLAVLCVCFGSLTHHKDDGADGPASSSYMTDIANSEATPALPLSHPPSPTLAPATAQAPALTHDCPPSERCAATTHQAALTLPAPEPPALPADKQSVHPRHTPTAWPTPRGPTRKHAPDLHVLQVQRT
ncbi:hypothetical protein [Streptomyces lasiicapitis]|uniref:hypothetical protein n=1 Tax=Streptomyces lasiicapitis TaxID=1923961 RepID=UPI00364B65A5